MGDLELVTPVLELPAEARPGLPVVAAVTIENRTQDDTFLFLPSWSFFGALAPLELAFAKGAERATFRAPHAHAEEPRGFPLEPGEARRFLFDASAAIAERAAGDWTVEVVYESPDGPARSAPVTLRVIGDGPAREAAAALLAPLPEPTWRAFVTARRPALEAAALDGLPPAGREAVAFHVFLQRALQGPVPVAALDPEGTKPFASGPLEAEAAALRVEILRARGDAAAAAAEEKAALARWPGLAWRFDDERRGFGALASARRSFGPK